MTAVILPGQEFDIEVEGVTFTVKALAGKQQIELLKAINKCSKLEDEDQLGALEATVEVLNCIFGEQRAQKYWEESVDTEMAHEIAAKVLKRGRLDEGEAKNLQSPHSSSAASSVEVVDDDAVETLLTASS